MLLTAWVVGCLDCADFFALLVFGGLLMVWGCAALFLWLCDMVFLWLVLFLSLLVLFRVLCVFSGGLVVWVCWFLVASVGLCACWFNVLCILLSCILWYDILQFAAVGRLVVSFGVCGRW